MCFCPDGDFYEALRAGRADVVTDHIETVTEHGITTRSGRELEADVIVTATGLKVQMAGGIDVSVDGVRPAFGDKYMWQCMMVQDVPNAAFAIAVATEEFVYYLTEQAHKMAKAEKKPKRSLGYTHVRTSASSGSPAPLQVPSAHTHKS